MDELSPEARRVLMAARADAEPNGADRARVYAAVATAITATTTSTAAASVASKAVSGGGGGAMLLKLGVAAVVFAVGTGVVVYTTFPNERPSANNVPAQTKNAGAPDVSATPPVATSPSAAPVVVHTEPTEPSRRSSHRTRNPATRTAPVNAAEVAQEVVWIGRAEAALEQRQPQAALNALREHARLFPEGELRQERWGLRVIALCSMQQPSTQPNTDTEARRDAAAFLRTHPHSVLVERVRSACEGTAASQEH